MQQVPHNLDLPQIIVEPIQDNASQMGGHRLAESMKIDEHSSSKHAHRNEKNLCREIDGAGYEGCSRPISISVSSDGDGAQGDEWHLAELAEPESPPPQLLNHTLSDGFPADDDGVAVAASEPTTFLPRAILRKVPSTTATRKSVSFNDLVSQSPSVDTSRASKPECWYNCDDVYGFVCAEVSRRKRFGIASNSCITPRQVATRELWYDEVYDEALHWCDDVLLALSGTQQQSQSEISSPPPSPRSVAYESSPAPPPKLDLLVCRPTPLWALCCAPLPASELDA